MNDKCGGVQLYRQLAKTCGKETEEAIVTTIKRIEREVEEMNDLRININGKTIVAKNLVVYTMLDGKGRCDIILIIPLSVLIIMTLTLIILISSNTFIL